MSKASRQRFRAMQHRVDKNLGRGFAAVGKQMRRKPKWLPLWVWIIPFYMIFPGHVIGYIRRFYKDQI